MKYIFTLFIIISPFLIFGQQPIKSSGNLPKDFTAEISEKSSSSSKRKNKKHRNAENQFHLESQYSIKQLMRSGLVLFNDPATLYLNDVIKQLNYVSKKKSKQPRVYALNSEAVNAFATKEGVICVTLGLLARLENEAELAFVLAHEIMHIEHNHSIKSFTYDLKVADKKKSNKKKNKKSKKKKNTVDTNNIGKEEFDRNLLKRNIFSQKMEVEADDCGLDLFMKSRYSTENLELIFEKLYYADMTFENTKIDKSIFNGKDYRLPDSLWNKPIEPIRPFEDYEDKQSTHPSAYKRKEKLMTKLSTNPNKGVKYIVGEERFLEIKELAQYQLPFLHLHQGDFLRAIYCANTLDKKSKYGMEMKKIIGKGLYKLAVHHESFISHNKKRGIYHDLRGEIQKLNNVLKGLSQKEIKVLAGRYNLLLQTQHEKDEELDLIVASCFKLIKEDIDSFKYFQDEDKESNWQKAFDNPDLLKQAKYSYKTKYRTKFTGEDVFSKLSDKKKKDIIYKGQKLGVRKVLILNPSFISINGKKSHVDIKRTEQKEKELLVSFEEMAKPAKIKLEILDPAIMEVNDAAKMNDLYTLNNYVRQLLANGDKDGVVPTNYGEVLEITKRYKTDQLLIPIILSATPGKKSNLEMSFSAIYYPYYYIAAPSKMLFDTFNKRRITYISILVDAKKGIIHIVDTNEGKGKDNKINLDYMTFETLKQLRRTNYR